MHRELDDQRDEGNGASSIANAEEEKKSEIIKQVQNHSLQGVKASLGESNPYMHIINHPSDEVR